MKKIVALILALVMLCLVSSSLASSDLVDYKFELANGLGYSAKEWCSSELNRAMLTILFSYELYVDGKLDMDNYSIGDSVVCLFTDQTTIAVFITGTKDTLLIFFTPSMSYSQYCFMPKATVTQITNSLSDWGTMYPNTASGISQAAQIITSALGD